MVTAFTFSLASSIFMVTNSRVKLKAQENVKSHCKFPVAFTIWICFCGEHNHDSVFAVRNGRFNLEDLHRRYSLP
ncbi:hypothetical protein GQ457_17G023560 [Hibiscus cannabinus]